MKHIYLGSDHRGHALKQEVKKWMDENKLDYTDLGAFNSEKVDYPDIAREVAEKVHETGTFGILICGTGQGMAIAANKAIHGVRAAVCTNVDLAKFARQHNNANICTLGGDMITSEEAIKIVDTFLKTQYEGGRHNVRLKKIEELEKNRHTHQ